MVIKFSTCILMICLLLQATTKPTVDSNQTEARKKTYIGTLQADLRDRRIAREKSKSPDEKKDLTVVINRTDATITLLKTVPADELSKLFSEMDDKNKELNETIIKNFGTPEDSVKTMLNREIKSPFPHTVRHTLKKFEVHDALYEHLERGMELMTQARVPCDLVVEVPHTNIITKDTTPTTYQQSIIFPTRRIGIINGTSIWGVFFHGNFPDEPFDSINFTPTPEELRKWEIIAEKNILVVRQP